MSLIFFDGFDGYSSAADGATHENWENPISVTIANTIALRAGAPAGGDYMQTTGSWAYKLPDGTYDNTVFVGFALRFETITPAVDTIIVSLATANTPNQVTEHGSMGLSKTNELLLRGISNTWVSTGFFIDQSVWYSIELEFTSHDTTGSIKLTVNGVVQHTLSGIDTKNGTISTAYLVLADGGETALFDDVYLFDSTGTVNNSAGGDLFSVNLDASADSSVQFTPLSGSNFSNIDDGILHDSDTTYVESTVVGHRDLYQLNNPSISVGDCHGVKVSVAARKTDANAINYKCGVKTGVDESQSGAIVATDTYQTSVNYFGTKDGGTTAFSAADLDALESVIEVA